MSTFFRDDVTGAEMPMRDAAEYDRYVLSYIPADGSSAEPWTVETLDPAALAEGLSGGIEERDEEPKEEPEREPSTKMRPLTDDEIALMERKRVNEDYGIGVTVR